MTLACFLFGHKFYTTKIEYAPHYLELSKRGLASSIHEGDFIRKRVDTPRCERCGYLPATQSKV